ncbi:MAG: S-methyl-5-thioribose-1-phosphate isomerase [Chlamydiae bacterium]|nr:S-methyl-5-thioribose-1-phosphate isomerase [Chlamydiota bacterium]
MKRLIVFSLLILTLQIEALTIDGFSIRYCDGILQVLNQQKLPSEEDWIDVKTPDEMISIITSLKIRGAPMIGMAALFSLAQLAEKRMPIDEIEKTALALKASRPTAVNLSCYIERLLNAIKESQDPYLTILQIAEDVYLEDKHLCEAMGKTGSDLIQEGERILTYCNTGSLTTAGIGTAIGVIKTAYFEGKKIHVYVCETRPLLQGGRLTAWEMERFGIPYTLICDNMAGTLMKQGKIDRVLVGADRIAVNGDFANKIGTYSLAVLAHHHRIPFHVVAPYTTIDPACPNGDAIKIEERKTDEVRGASGSFGKVIWSPPNAPVYNPAFDVTPADLVESYILDRGCFSKEEFMR